MTARFTQYLRSWQPVTIFFDRLLERVATVLVRRWPGGSGEPDNCRDSRGWSRSDLVAEYDTIAPNRSATKLPVYDIIYDLLIYFI